MKLKNLFSLPKFSNWLLVIAVTFLLISQLYGCFTGNSDDHTKYTETEELNNEHHNHSDEHEHVNPRTH